MFGVTILCAKLTNNVLIKKKNSKKRTSRNSFLTILLVESNKIITFEHR